MIDLFGEEVNEDIENLLKEKKQFIANKIADECARLQAYSKTALRSEANHAVTIIMQNCDIYRVLNSMNPAITSENDIEAVTNGADSVQNKYDSLSNSNDDKKPKDGIDLDW